MYLTPRRPSALGTIHHSARTLIYDINTSNAATQTDATAGYRGGFSLANMEAAYRLQLELSDS